MRYQPKKRMKFREPAVMLAFPALLIGLLLLFIAPAAAEPDLSAKQAEVDGIKAEVSSINLAAEQAVERYNQANSELEETGLQIAENEKALADASAKLAEAQMRLDRRLENIYRQGSLSFMDVLLNTSSFNELLSRFDLLGKIGAQDKSDIDEVVQYKSETENAKADLDRTRQRQEELVDSVATEKSQVESQLAARQAILTGAEGEVAQLLAQQVAQNQPTAGSQSPQNGQPGGNSGGSETPQTEPSPTPGPGPAPESPYSPPPPPVNGDAASIAMQYLGVPYVWGGASPSGFDCSGLVMYVYAQLGIYLPHSASAQYYSGTPVSYSELAAGDLVFFGQPISHVGIYIGGGSMIHAPMEGMVVSITGISGGGSYSGACRL